MSSSLETIEKNISDLRRRIGPEMCSELEGEYRKAQQRADTVAQAFGDSAPRWLEGERLSHYRQRLLKPWQKYSADWQRLDLSRADDSMLELAERSIYGDALQEARLPTKIPAGQLVERYEKDRTGRVITRFFGDPGACWNVFKIPPKNVIGWGAK